LHDLAGEPAGNEPNKQYNQQAFARHVHLLTSRLARDEHYNWLNYCLYQIDHPKTSKRFKFFGMSKIERWSQSDSRHVGSITASTGKSRGMHHASTTYAPRTLPASDPPSRMSDV
jgi:hypothetical protein